MLNTENPLNDFFTKDDVLKSRSFFNSIINFRTFSEDISEEQRITESLITSYDTVKLFKTLEKEFGAGMVTTGQINMPNEIPKQLFTTNYGTVFGLVIFIKNYTKNYKPKIDKILKLFGYHSIGEEFYDNNTTIKLSLEPSHPIIINNILNPKINYIYHVTLNKNLPKIEKIGLAPRDSKTTFTHSGSRIYFMISTSPIAAVLMGDALARDRGQILSDYALLRVEYNPNKYTYYMDQACFNLKFSPPLLGCFITKNVPPEEITILSTSLTK
jgi:hypothetical protein